MEKMNLLTLVLFVIAPLAWSQQKIPNYQSFAIDNREVVWMQVYHHADSAGTLSSNLFHHLSGKVWIAELHFEGADIIGKLVDYRPDYKRYGGRYLNTSSILRNGYWNGHVRISFKDGKYRVFLDGLHYRALQPATGSGKATIEKHEVTGSLTQWALDDYRTSFRKNRMKNLDILHMSFKDSFTLTYDQLIDRDW